jgi:AraC-like DNA-binding protein
MSASLDYRVLYRSPVVTVTEVHCRPRDHRCGGEETTGQHQIVFVRRGCFVKHVHRREVVADPNQVLFFTRGEPYRVSHPVAGGDECVTLTLPPEGLRDLLQSGTPSTGERLDRPFERSHCPSGPLTDLLQRAVFHVLRHGRAPDLVADELLLTLLGRVVGQAQPSVGARARQMRPDTARAHRTLAAAAQTVLAGKFTERLPLAELSRAVHSSPYHLCRVFQQQCGLTISGYRNRLRLRAALERLACGEHDTTALALDLGYSSRGHFSDSFRREFGLAPRTFRRLASTRRLRELSKILGA